jgi:RNA binding exosome subunit
MHERRLIKTAEITVFSHATEDEEKVKQAIKRIASFEHNFEEQRLSGHYDDPITLIKSKISKKKEATDLLSSIVNRLSSLDRQTLLDELPNHVDPQGNLYLRLDKQRAFNGKITLHENDPIRIKFKFQLPYKADPSVTIREYIVNLEEDDTS